MPVKNIKRKTNDGLQGIIVGLTDEEKQALIKDGVGKSVPPCLNLIDTSGSNPVVRTSITEEEEKNLALGLYNSVFYYDVSSPESIGSVYFPEPITYFDNEAMFSVFNISVDATAGTGTISSSSVYKISPGITNADGTIQITIEKLMDVPFAGGGGGVSPCLNLMDIENGSIRTSITEEEKTNLEKGLYNSVHYVDFSLAESLGEAIELILYLPQPFISVGESIGFSSCNLQFDKKTRIISATSYSVYTIAIGEKNTDGNYPITIEKLNDVNFGGGGSSSVTIRRW